MRLLLVGSTDGLPAGFDAWLAANHWSVDQVPDLDTASARIDVAPAEAGAGDCGHDACLVGPRRDAAATGLVWADHAQFARFVRAADAHHLAAVVLESGDKPLRLPDGSLVDRVGDDVSARELSWRLATLTRFQAQFRRIERELKHMESLGDRLHRHVCEIDGEMRLASRLQRDFLPRGVDRIGPLRFGTIYRPASWVSGDIFDIQRLDDRHVGFYIADAVGHGVAAGLLTVFIKQSLAIRPANGGCGSFLSPGESLRALNDALAQHSLPNSQFVTCAACVVNTETLTMQFARGGHPYPYLIRADGRTLELQSVGGLMGLFEDLECPTEQVQLQPGDKVLLYTDGIEAAFDSQTPGTHVSRDFHEVVKSLAHCGASETITRLNEALDRQEGSLAPEDDVTVLAVEVDRSS